MPRQPAKAAPATSSAVQAESDRQPARKRLPFPTSESVQASKAAMPSPSRPVPRKSLPPKP